MLSLSTLLTAMMSVVAQKDNVAWPGDIVSPAVTRMGPGLQALLLSQQM